MIKHAAVLAVAVAAALAAAQGLTPVGGARAFARPAAADTLEPTASASESAATTAPAGAASLSKSDDGHYWAEAEVEGRWIKFLVDTGASTVALTGADARRLGLDLNALSFDRDVITANGPTKAAGVTLEHVAVAGARVDKVAAVVVREGLPTSLLGMSYLGRLSRFEATPTTLILRP